MAGGFEAYVPGAMRWLACLLSFAFNCHARLRLACLWLPYLFAAPIQPPVSVSAVLRRVHLPNLK